jgi:hypothetical protein
MRDTEERVRIFDHPESKDHYMFIDSTLVEISPASVEPEVFENALIEIETLCRHPRTLETRKRVLNLFNLKIDQNFVKRTRENYIHPILMEQLKDDLRDSPRIDEF